jgi:hypothetical protein
MKAILTKYVSATNTKPSRIKAGAEGVASKFFSVSALEDELVRTGQQGIHDLAARKFATINGWHGSLVSGGLPNGDWCHCFERRPQAGNVFEVVVEGCTPEQAERVLNERLGYDEDYGFNYSVKYSVKYQKADHKALRDCLGAAIDTITEFVDGASEEFPQLAEANEKLVAVWEEI